MGVADYYLKKIEENRQTKLPLCFFNEDGVKALNDAFEKTPYVVSLFYKNFGKYIDFSCFDKISEGLKNIEVNDTDKKIIENLVKIKNEDPELFFDYLGNLYHLGELTDELVHIKERKVVFVSLILFIYMNTIEVLTRLIGNLMKNQIIKNGSENDNRNFLRRFEDNEHPTFGEVIEKMVDLGFLDNRKESILTKNKEFRNKIGHANVFYDSKRNLIYFTNGKQLNPSEVSNDLNGLNNFLKYFIFELNGKEGDISSKIKPIFNQLSNKFIKVERSGQLKQSFYSVMLDWKEEN